MALAHFFTRSPRRSHANGSIFEPFSSFPSNIFHPTTDLAIFERPDSGYGKDGSGRALSGRTKVDWVETPQALVFEADLPVSRRALSGRTEVDWVETPEAHVFKADLPGLKKEEIKMEVLDGKVLSISGERTNEKRKETDYWRCVERSHGKFCRQFGLPDNPKVDEMSAKVEDGVLTVKVPKSQAEVQKVRAINVS